jgi:hypothetical protein
MLKKTMLGVAAAAFGAAALLPTTASAHWHHHHHHGGWGFYAGPAFYYPAYSGYSYGYGPECYLRKRWVWTPRGWALVRRPICY